MSLSGFAFSGGAIADGHHPSPRPKRAPTKRTVVVQPDLTAAPEAR